MDHPPLPEGIELPTPRVALATVKAWSSEDPALGGLLARGVSEAAALLIWGADLLRAGRGADAVVAFRVAVGLAPDAATSWTNLGIAFSKVSARPQAVACFERSVTLVATQPDVWLLLGMAREAQGDTSRARAQQDYEAALALDPESAPAWACLGAVLQRQGDPGGAAHAFEACLAIAPRDAAVWASLGRAHYEDGSFREARRAYTTASRLSPSDSHFNRLADRTRFVCDLLDGASVGAALRRRPDGGVEHLRELFEAAGAALTGFGHHEAALRLAHARLERWPASPSARYLLDSLLGDAAPPRAPDAYLVETFDAFASDFDAHLVEVLGYDVPETLCRLVAEVTPPERRYRTLDGGCGTGLCAPHLRPISTQLTGVDLSPGMLERARARGLYDALACEELTGFLACAEGAFDLLVLADVLIYFGALEPLLGAAARALSPGGLLALSVEVDASVDHRLTQTGRFAHAPGYVERAAASAFVKVDARRATLRREVKGRVAGALMVLKRR